MRFILFAGLLFSCTHHVYVHQVEEVVCDTVQVIDTITRWEPAIHIHGVIHGDTLRRVWVQDKDGTWYQYFKNKQP